MAIRQVTTPQHDAGTVLEWKERALKPPAMYKVLLLSDDHTPVEFVVMVPQQYFSKGRETAAQTMLTAHREGKGVCGLYTRGIVATKVELMSTHTRQTGHPLQYVMEEA